MTHALPDVSLSESPLNASALEWVGMEGIDLPITLAEPGYRRQLHAKVDMQVDLPEPGIKGIHMSRLYRLLEPLANGRALLPGRLRQLLRAMVASHGDCHSSHARLRLHFSLLVRRAALKSDGLSGWKAYPMVIDASLVGGQVALTSQVTVAYSSTCPCSAALTRQLQEQGFLAAFAGQGLLAPETVAAWLRQHGTLATPHSQRSLAEVSVSHSSGAGHFGLLGLIDTIEQALATPVQTAVKRADEQAFAALNGQNLMFVEDAARRLQGALAHYPEAKIKVRHMESLHPHDAVAMAG
ncbi:GTP cyclohydrolase FolE2 [Gallaecimonas pentaromativorans]|uniref:GTP cyclohydrolase FolE2 n=1 Tax=Gallaecimonas pentaromativorans TaxID=584787 RepID=UPI003A8FF92A